MFLKANCEDSDQTPHSVASDLGLHCMPISHTKNAMFIWVICLSKCYKIQTYPPCNKNYIGLNASLAPVLV